MKLFLDANVIFFASNNSSNLQRLLTALKHSHTLITSTYAQVEAVRNLRAKRPNWEFGYTQLIQGIEIVESIDRALDIEIAAKDRPILATAIASGCDFLITGDKRDFGHLFGKSIRGVKIVSPLMLVESLKQL